MIGTKEGACCICGTHGKLTFEHIPPKSAFNNHLLLVASVQDYLDSEKDDRKIRHRESRKGFGKYSLCEKCNNLTGAWYGSEYVAWAYQGVRFLGSSGALAMPYHIFPGRVAKQIVAMFGTLNGSGFFQRHPELQKYVLNKNEVGLPEKFRLYCFLTSKNSHAFRASGIVAMMVTGHHRPLVFSEMSFVPFGYVLTVDSLPPSPDLFEISFFFNERYDSYRDLHLPIPSKETHSYFPGDYRTKDEWDLALKRRP
ncbi:hypothetical protein [Agrobacterium tumefaciens]|uniref:hypothetical protein n=1 Tax=Agrobacterium tumefaciens TaxID=358 RepID=UPI00157322CE|nr:hypothetical protein [Agrobacterium tumefaciens]NTA15456.1 hypothetical protein [Agrobacterium tumefaciens]WCK71688.1 hypothetical protein G6L96_004245 [Agrobacterium tumefaciens]